MSKIVKKSYLHIREEREAGGTITPGMLLDVNSDGEFIAHATEGGPAAAVLALEDIYSDGEITDDYAEGDRVFAQHFVSGERAYGIASGESTDPGVAIGDYVISAGDGTLKTLSKDSVDSVAEVFHAIGRAEEAAVGGARFTFTII